MPVTRIIFLGDSITEAGAMPGGWVTTIADSLAHRGIEVLGAGISGNKVPDLEARLERDVLAKNPSLVVIYIGINDVWHHFEFDHTTGTEPDVYERGLYGLIASIREAGANVLLCTPSVIGEIPSSTAPVNRRLAEYADISRSVAAATGTYLCDLRLAFEEYLATNNPDGLNKGILTTDGVHLNDEGNRFVAAFMLSHLRTVLRSE